MSDFQDYFEIRRQQQEQQPQHRFEAQPERHEVRPSAPIPRNDKHLGHRQLATGGARLLACLIDFVLIYLMPLTVPPLVGVSPPATGLAVVLMLIASYSGFLVLLISGGTARYANTVGKHLMGIRVALPLRVGATNVVFAQVGAVRTLFRICLHLVDVAFFMVGFLWVFKSNGYNRTWADSWAHVVHIANHGDHSPLPKAPKGAVNAAY